MARSFRGPSDVEYRSAASFDEVSSDEASLDSRWLYLIAAIVAVGAVGAVIVLRKKKREKKHERELSQAL